MQGSSIPEIDLASAYIKMNEDGSFNLLLGATDLGTGSDTIMAQIAAEEIGTEPSAFNVYSSDTDLTPFDVGAYASSTTYLSGQAVRKAAAKIREFIILVASRMMDVPMAQVSVAGSSCIGPSGQILTFAQVATHSLYVADQAQIQAGASHIAHKSPPPFAAHFAEVEVDTDTGEVKVLTYVSATDCGTAINPRLAQGQVEGAVLNGISFALTEQYLYDQRGRMLNPDFNSYKVFGAGDVPDIRTILVPSWESSGPFGAKSVSEIGINGPMPAIANAIFDAVGVRLTRSPFTPETILRALKRL